MIIVIIGFSFFFPSLISLLFVVVSHNMMFVIAQKTEDRVFIGWILILVNLLILLIVISWKLTFKRSVQFDNLNLFIQTQQYYVSLGFSLQNVDETEFKFDVNSFTSYFLEMVVLAVYLSICQFYMKLKKKLKAVEKDDKIDEIIFVKLYETKQRLEKEKKTVSLGTMSIQQEREQTNRQFHIEQAKQIQKQVLRIQMNNSYFSSFNMAFFLLVIILQIFQSMNFNGLFDVPQIFMILLLVSIYGFRSHFKVQFGQVSVFIAYFSSFTCFLKILWIQIAQIDFIYTYLTNHSSQKVIQIIQIVFGSEFNQKHLSLKQLAPFYAAIILLFYFCHAWRGSKWSHIREKTEVILNGQDHGSYSKFLFYLDNKDDLNCISTYQQNIDQLESIIDSKSQNSQNKDKFTNQSIFKTIRKDFNQYISTLVIWLLRLLLILQAYMYHSYNGLAHLLWVLLSFILPQKWILFASIIVMIPLYTAEFFIIYGARIPGLNISSIYNQNIFEYFTNDEQDFVGQMKSPELEQFLMFVILCLFYLNVLCFYECCNQKEEYIKTFFQSMIETKNRNNLRWKFYFFILKYAHFVPLLILFSYGCSDLNNLRNSSIMILFTIFISSEYLYRKTSIFLNLIASFFILGQYYFSLNYRDFVDDAGLMEKLQWLNLYEKDKLNQWKDTQDIYFRFTPYPFDFFVLFLASLMNMVNILFNNSKKNEENSQLCYEAIRNRFSQEIFWLINIFSVLDKIFRVMIIFIVVISIRYMQTNFISWVFYALFIINVAFIARQDKKKTTYYKCIISAKILNYYSALILVMEILFLMFFGLNKNYCLYKTPGKIDKSYDNWLFRNFPTLYEHLDLIGFRYFVDKSLFLTKDQILQNQKEWFNITFISYIGYQLISVYLINHFTKQLKQNEIDMDIPKEYIKKLFEYDNKIESKERDSPQYDENSRQVNEELGSFEDYQDDNYKRQTAREDQPRQKTDIDTQEGIFPKKDRYSMYDFLDLYENLRFREDYTVYKLMDWWWLFDILAYYGHFITNLLILVISLYYKISFYMIFNILCICLFYSILSIRMLKKSQKLKSESCLQDQTDTFHSHQITKEYKKYQLKELHNLRNQIWKIQFIILVLVMCISFPTSIIVKHNIKIKSYQAKGNQQLADSYDSFIFWLFISGIYKDTRSENQMSYYISFFMIGFALVLERIAINWMFDRFGCTYNKIQKFIEIDLRKQAISNPETWEVNPPKYNIDSYRNHYFYDNFEELKTRFEENSKDSYTKRKLGLQTEFIPLKEALRIRDFVTFSVKLQGRCKDLKLDKLVEDKLDECDELRGCYKLRECDKLEDCKGLMGCDKLKKCNYHRGSNEPSKCDKSSNCDYHRKCDELIKCNEFEECSYHKEYDKLQGCYQFKKCDKFNKCQYHRECDKLERCEESKQCQELDKCDYHIEMDKQLGCYKFKKGSQFYKCDYNKECDKFQECEYHKQWNGLQWCYKIKMYKRLKQCDYHRVEKLIQEDKLKMCDSLKQCGQYKEFDKIILNNELNRCDDCKNKCDYHKEVEKFKQNENEKCDKLQECSFHQQCEKLPTIDFSEFYEKYQVFQDYKIKQLNKILKESVDRKYKISFYKGVQLSLESLILLLMMITVFIKSNIFSIIYMILVFRIIFSKQKLQIMNHAMRYVSVCLILQYLIYIMNMTYLSTPEQFPSQFLNYPFRDEYKNKYSIPFFIKIDMFKDIQISYLFGIAIQVGQIHSLIFDFLIMYLIFILLFNYGNPVLEKGMKKTFWSFPYREDNDRLSDNVKAYVQWFINCDFEVKEQTQNSDDQKQTIDQIQREYCQQIKIKFNNGFNNINRTLENYINLKYSDKEYDDEFYKKVKWELKEQSIYFRLVKQGSVLVYLTFHIFTIFVIFLTSILRQSFLSLGYAFILLPFMKTGSEVLNQRVQKQLNRSELTDKIKELEEEINNLQKQGLFIQSKYDQLEQLKNELKSILIEKQTKSHEQLQEEQNINKDKEWQLIKIISVYLLIFAIIDITIQGIYQLPTFEENKLMKDIGIQKIWSHQNFNFHMNFTNYWEYGRKGLSQNEIGYQLNWNSLIEQCFLGFIVAVISLQKEIFQSDGFQKFITQTDGSMDLLVKLASEKAKIMAYVFNNQKIIKIINIQKKKEQIITSVDKVKQQIVKWRQFTKKIINNDYPSQQTLTEASNTVKHDDYKKEELEQKAETQWTDLIQQLQKSQNNNQYQQKDKTIKKNKFAQKLAKQLCLAKKEKLNFLSNIYIYLQNNFVNKIMFKNKKGQLQNLLKSQIVKGEVEILSELEQIMMDEAQQIIEAMFEDRETLKEFRILAKGFQGKKLLESTNLDKIIKFSQMQNSWEFTRPFSMAFKLIETFYYIIISNTHNLIYMFMILSMFTNAGLLSLVYPIAVLGYALLEENRPRKEFWDFVRVYTQIILGLKFIWNLEIINKYAHTPTYNDFEGMFKIGLIDYIDLFKLTMYMLPEVMIISLVMLNEIALKLNGLYYEIEQDIENINEGIQRFIEKQDSDKQQNNQNSSASLEILFKSREATQYYKKQENSNIEVQNQLDKLKSISYQIQRATKNFDVKLKSQIDNHRAQQFIQNDIIKKPLESDSLMFIEGQRSQYLMNDLDDQVEDCISAGDFEDDLENKIDNVKDKDKPKPGFFENIKYFDRLFPNLKIQKPGFDLYASTTFFLGILAVYVFMFFDKLTVNETEFLKGAQETNNIFKGEMSICLILIISIIILERYINRSDTKAEQKSILSKSHSDSQCFFNKEQFFETQNSQRYMSTIIKTMRTGDFDVDDSENQEFLKQQFDVKLGDDGQVQQSDINRSQTKITVQQKTKYILHWVLLVVVHAFIFWVLPIKGNYQLYAQYYCSNDESKYKYGCKNFHNNSYLVMFYLLWLIYFILSALQIRYGLPIMKKPSSILQYNDSILALAGANMFYAIPFAVEVRCLLDFTFTKTSLDIFQFWQTFVYHVELYVAKNGNVSYTRRILGTRTPLLDKCIFGWIITAVILGVLVGPFYLFSDYGGFIATNPVQSAEISVALVINKTIVPSSFTQKNTSEQSLNIYQIQQNTTQNSTDSQYQLRASVPYQIYSVNRPYLRDFDQSQFQNSSFSKWTETRFFNYKQVQECVSNEFSDTNWQMNKDLRKQFQTEINYATQQKFNFSISLMIKYIFTRENPTDKKETKGKEFKVLNYTLLEDCITGQQLKKLANINCSDPQSNKSAKIRFAQVYSRELILGATDKTYPLYRKGIPDKDQMYDVFVQYRCPSTWIVYTSRVPRKFNINEKHRFVNSTCQPVADLTPDEYKMFSQIKSDMENNKDVQKSRFRLFLFSMLVSSSLFASYNVSTFYTTVVLVMGQQIRPLLLFGTWRGWIYESTHPDPVIKVIEYIYMKRHEEDFYGEEEGYRILQEIVRSPELFKAISGSSLKGVCDPDLDKLDPIELKKFNHLDQLERQGFEVEELKKQIFSKNT